MLLEYGSTGLCSITYKDVCEVNLQAHYTLCYGLHYLQALLAVGFRQHKCGAMIAPKGSKFFEYNKVSGRYVRDIDDVT